ncbi:DUF397 domain-containing protein [Actinomadura flavalba]|uniref:DUF397 domain-containing protein n=1 Tax=Actinomadura flavalba TaxID=1120938 RepID=UPI0003745242|nr:DUF397 domain-containing protein [Actinomadura flavalba]
MNEVRRELIGASWRTSSHSGSGDQCVEVADMTGGRHAVRDSKDRSGPVLVVSRTGWRALVDTCLTDPSPARSRPGLL